MRIFLIIGGLLSIVSGILSLPLMFVYTLTQNNDHDYIFILCFGAIALGIYLLYRASKISENKQP